MKELSTIHEQDINPDAPQTDSTTFKERIAARAVLLDNAGEVHMLHVSLDNYHKLPGGGIEAGEDIKTALERELLEEVGCRAKVIAEVGMIVEYRDQFNLKQTSYCFLAKQVGEEQPTDLQEDEIAHGFVGVQLPNIDAAIKQLQNDAPTTYEGKFIQKRDLLFLQAAKERI
ncbi:MAG TPA: NUDIX domain-containing protein [Candidatus Saccharimonadales bacterium]|nr:NUDIX domain-containing protein [Candidatus Saccharimonadales bacterium]